MKPLIIIALVTLLAIPTIAAAEEVWRIRVEEASAPHVRVVRTFYSNDTAVTKLNGKTIPNDALTVGADWAVLSYGDAFITWRVPPVVARLVETTLVEVVTLRHLQYRLIESGQRSSSQAVGVFNQQIIRTDSATLTFKVTTDRRPL
jgi:hypothetical protein